MFNLRSRFVRLALIMTCVPALIMIMVGHISVRQFDKQLEREIENQINDELVSLVEIYTDQGPSSLADTIQLRMKMRPSERAVSYYELTDPAGKLLIGNLKNTADKNTAGPTNHIRATTLKGGETLSVGRSLDAKNKALKSLRTLFQKAILLSIFIGFGIGAISAWLFRRRLRDINTVCYAVADGDVSARLGEDHKGDEISQLSGNINQMLGRIQNLIAVRKRISDQVAHELRTPLTRLDRVLQDAEKATKNAQPIQAARQELKSCVTLLDALLDVSALEAQSGDKSDFEVFDLSALVRDMCNFYEALALEKYQSLTFESETACRVEGDKTQLGRLIANLIDNAIKYTPETGAITVRVVQLDQQGVLTVSDTGPGIAPDNKRNIFTPFFRNKDNQTSSGHGLGLAMVKAISDRHAGTLEISSNPDHAGACFKFTIAAVNEK